MDTSPGTVQELKQDIGRCAAAVRGVAYKRLSIARLFLNHRIPVAKYVRALFSQKIATTFVQVKIKLLTRLQHS